jgi:LysR family glycine cleavage system transcriptional activator
LLPVLTDAFDRILRRSREISSGNKDLRIICPPTVSIRWLIPRLDAFHALHPDTRIRLTTAFYDWQDFFSGEFDLGIGCVAASERPDGIEALPLFPMMITPACAPALLAQSIPLGTPEDLVNCTLLHESPDHHDWAAWLTAFDIQGVDPQSGTVLPNLDMAVKAAVMGKGVVMGDLVLTREEFETGQLVMPFEKMKCTTDWGDFALWGPTEGWNDSRVKAFKSWISETASDDAAYCARQLDSQAE